MRYSPACRRLRESCRNGTTLRPSSPSGRRVWERERRLPRRAALARRRAARAARRGRRRTCSRCSRIRRARSTSVTSRTTRWATSWRTSGAATAPPSSTRWGTTPSACRPRTPPSAPASRRPRSSPRNIARIREQMQAPGRLGRLGDRDRHQRPGLLPLDPVDLPAPARARAGRAARGGRQLVPGRPDRAGQRAGHRRPLRALRRRGGAAPAHPVVLPHHRVRPAPARRHGRADRLARAGADPAAQLDRPLRGRPRGLPGRGRRRGDPGLHDPPGHALRGDLLRARPRAPGRSGAWSQGRPEEAAVRAYAAAAARETRRRARRRRARRRPASSPGATSSTRSTASRCRSGWPTTS